MKKEIGTIIKDTKIDIESLVGKIHEQDLENDEKLKHIHLRDILYDNSGSMGKTVSIANIFNHEFCHELANRQHNMSHLYNGNKSTFKVLLTDEIDKLYSSRHTEFRANHCYEISEHAFDISSLVDQVVTKNIKFFDKTIIRLSEKPWLFQDLI